MLHITKSTCLFSVHISGAFIFILIHLFVCSVFSSKEIGFNALVGFDYVLLLNCLMHVFIFLQETEERKKQTKAK